MSKKYTNVYTILEKIKKGDIEKKEDRYFGKMRYFKKQDLVTPHLHYIDETRLENIVRAHISNNDVNSDQYLALVQKFLQKNPEHSKRPNAKEFVDKMKEIYKDFPKHLIYDIFKMYYDKTEKLEFEERTDANFTKFKFLEKANSPIRKIMSEKSYLKSSIFTREIIGYILSQLAFSSLTNVDKDKADSIMNSIKSDASEFDNKDAESSLENLFEKQESKDMLENALKKAEQLCKSLDGSMTTDQQEQMYQNCSSSLEASKLSPYYIETMESNLKRIAISFSSIKDKIKKLLDKSISYFAGRDMPIYEDIFNSDNIAGLDDFIGLHPKLRSIMMEDILIKDVKHIGKVDLYVDISGSMSDTCGIKSDDGELISKIDFCKSFIFKLKELDILNDFYTFNTTVKKRETDTVSIAMLDVTGGTMIDSAISSIERNQVNAIVITDAEDKCSIYSKNVFFIGVSGARFHYFDETVRKEYVNNDQIVIFDGKNIQKVNLDGMPIKVVNV